MTTTPADPAIQVRGLTKSYAAVEVLRGVDLKIARGSITALLGSNGAGKTTTVRILATLLTADAGTAQVNGFDVRTEADRVRASISLTGQFAAVDDVLTGRENLVLIARLRHLPDPRRVADELLAQFGLTEAASRKVSTYSGGMRRRLDLAMSLTGHPPVVFLDEPTTGLDPQARREVWAASSPAAAPPCCSPPSTWPKPKNSQTGSPSCTRGGSSSRAPWPSSRLSSHRPGSSTWSSSPPSRRSSSTSPTPPLPAPAPAHPLPEESR